MCNCGRKTEYLVSYPNGTSEVKKSATAARIAAAKVAGATVTPRPVAA